MDLPSSMIKPTAIGLSGITYNTAKDDPNDIEQEHDRAATELITIDRDPVLVTNRVVVIEHGGKLGLVSILNSSVVRDMETGFTKNSGNTIKTALSDTLPAGGYVSPSVANYPVKLAVVAKPVIKIQTIKSRR
jgi:hypothetical protein